MGRSTGWSGLIPNNSELELAMREQPEARLFPLYTTVLADVLTPVGMFAQIREQSTHAFLLESVVGGEKIARYSFLGFDPALVVEASGQCLRVSRFRRGGPGQFGRGRGGQLSVPRIEQTPCADPLRSAWELVAGLPAYKATYLPRFTGGLVGYIGYDTVRYVEAGKLGAGPEDDRGLPDLMLGLYDHMIIFDHIDRIARVCLLLDVGRAAERTRASVREAYSHACRRLELFTRRVAKLAESASSARLHSLPRHDYSAPVAYRSNRSRKRFEDMVCRALEYIRAGDIFQVVLSQRLRVQSEVDGLLIYRALRSVNPSPFMFYLQSPAVTLVGASPEILCRVEDGTVTSRPLAGTIRRGRDAAEDARLARELLESGKDRSEHIMLVDLHRNDVGRVCQAGSVKITEQMVVEKYSHVMHISSEVQGRLAEGRTALDALQAGLPVGTVSGAPKIRAMQIIDELEPHRRGPYGGAVGYFDFSGQMDTCIALRTMVLTRDAVGRQCIDVQVGAGVVAESDPAAEYEETMNKGRAMLRAIALAQAAESS